MKKVWLLDVLAPLLAGAGLAASVPLMLAGRWLTAVVCILVAAVVLVVHHVFWAEVVKQGDAREKELTEENAKLKENIGSMLEGEK